MKKTSKPFVGISGSFHIHDGLPIYSITTHYADVVSKYLNAIPIMITPSLDNHIIEHILPSLSGIILTGGKTNIDPSLYNKEKGNIPHNLLDPKKDYTDIHLAKQCKEKGIPVLGICRGLQAMNVALGGTLTQCVAKLPGKHAHVPHLQESDENLYQELHSIFIEPNKLISRFFNEKTSMVNSMHFQAIETLAPSLTIEALSDDHVIEAVSLKNSSSFFLGVQWHPEHPTTIKSDINQSLFKSFSEAIYSYHMSSLKGKAMS